MNTFTTMFLLSYAALFSIVNPIGSAPLFLGLTQFTSDPQRIALARRVAINSFFLLLGSFLVGSYVLEFFGLSLPAVRIGGGLVVSAFGWKLLNAEATSDDERVAITLGSQEPKFAGLQALALQGVAAIAGLLAIATSVYLCYRFAEGTVARLGKTGTNVVVRLSAFIMICIGIQIVWSGWSAMSTMPH
jgi:multiple antibiotic resistance protein